ncbi:CHAT domain-containing protein [Nocardia sp. NPDC057227]|uniref:CHAT domain-containing protein n=1 Tax=Nocardia sp. NPDC057227 TaxID=3346056 RepID=UPI0036260C5A
MNEVDVLIRAVDAGDTYLYWRWLDDPDRPEYTVLPAAELTALLTRLVRALPAQLSPTESRDEAARRALVTGELADPGRERELSAALAAVILPPALREQLARRAAAGTAIRVRLTPSPRLASVPWELLVVTPEHRLLDLARIEHELPAAVHADRAVTPRGWAARAEQPILAVIDPVLPAGLDGLSQTLEQDDVNSFTNRLFEYGDRVSENDLEVAIGARFTRVELSAALRTPRSRFLYFGHVSAKPDEPGSAALHLSDGEQIWGRATPLAGNAGPAAHRPFSALDLFLGTHSADEAGWRPYGTGGPADGHVLWPMPPRVAVIACEGGADYRAMETFGLVVAMANAGAELITTTRWVTPSTAAFRAVGMPTGSPTIDLALRVDAAHETEDPAAVLTAWQRDRLRHWCGGGDIGVADTPLIWAALSTTVAKARPGVPVPDSAAAGERARPVAAPPAVTGSRR